MDPEREVKPKIKIKPYFKESFGVMTVAFELGFIIALPIVLLGLGGKWLDQRYGTGFYIYLGILLAIILTSIWVYRRYKEMVETLVKASNTGKENINKQKE